MMETPIIEPRQVHEMMKNDVKFVLLDCRELWEYQIAHIEGAALIPIQQIPRRLDEIPKDQPIVVYCHAGVRSYDAACWLQQQGVNAVSMSGGIDQWSREIDPEMPRY